MGGEQILAIPTSELCNHSLTLRSFPDTSKFAKPEALFKGLKNESIKLQVNITAIFII